MVFESNFIDINTYIIDVKLVLIDSNKSRIDIKINLFQNNRQPNDLNLYFCVRAKKL